MLVLSCLTGAARAENVEKAIGGTERSITAGREAFEGGGNYPWYEAATDELQPIALPTPWELWNLPVFPLRWLAWGLVAVLLGALAFVLFKLIRSQRDGGERRTRRASDTVLEPDRVEALPFMAERPREDLLGAARRYYLAGDYSEAIIYLFSYELVELDKSALIQLAKGKTNRQYLRETGSVQPLRRLLELTIVTFEDVFFGRRPLDRGGFEACWNHLPEFESLVARAAP